MLRGQRYFKFSRKNNTISHGIRSEILFTTDGCEGKQEEIRFLEHVEVLTNIAFTVRGALEMHLTSPAGWSSQSAETL
jgi:subtilisin-like proprotein convertase family protein